MTRLITLLTAFVFISVAAAAQSLPPLQPEQDACGALELCGSTFYTPYSYTGYGAIQEQAYATACYGESNSVWLKVTVATAGTIAFTITPVNNTNDYDFSVFDVTGLSCTDVNATTRVRCDGCDINSAPGGLTGLSASGSGTSSGPGPGIPFLSVINANAGDVYLILIDNFNTGSGVAGFTIDFSASTATFVQSPLPTLANVLPACSYAQQVTITTSVPVKCSSIAPNGSDFSVTGGAGGTVVSAVGAQCSGSNGYTSTITLTFGSQLPPGTYTINAQVGTDGNTLLNLCDNALIPPSTLTFTVLPYAPPALIAPDTPACLATLIRLTSYVKCSTVAPDGSDFVISGPSPVQVVSAIPRSCNGGVTDSLELVFNAPITVPGTYTLSSQNGSDGNGLVDSCGVALSNSVSWVVSDRGFVNATVSPVLLCKPGYAQLQAAISTPPPPSTNPVVCGAGSTMCYTALMPHYAGTQGYPGVSIPGPLPGVYSDARTQWIYKAAELQNTGMRAGTIKRIALDITDHFSAQPYLNLTIKIGCTSQADLSSGAFIAGLTTVWTAATYTPDTGRMEFILSQPYNWDGVSNLVVEFCYDNLSGTGNDNVVASPAFTAATLQSAGFTGSGCTFTSGTAYSLRPNVIFYSCGQPPYSGYGLAWSPGDYVGDSTAANTVVYVPGNAAWQVQIMDQYYCYRRDTTAITLSVATAGVSPRDTAVCLGQSVPLVASGGVSYVWFPSTGLNCTTCQNVTANPTQTTTYYVAATDANGCSDTASTTVVIWQPPVVDAGRDTSIVIGGSVMLLGNALGGATVSCSPVGALSDPRISAPIASPTITTTYTLSVIDTNGCINSDETTVEVTTDGPINIPTAFSPNGDGRNDVFHVVYPNIQKLMEFRIFNRWGREVFSTTDIKGGWDGSYNGEPQDMGVYQYLIRVATGDGEMRTFHGSLTLIR